MIRPSHIHWMMVSFLKILSPKKIRKGISMTTVSVVMMPVTELPMPISPRYLVKKALKNCATTCAMKTTARRDISLRFFSMSISGTFCPPC